jgi:hypothetical protein
MRGARSKIVFGVPEGVDEVVLEYPDGSAEEFDVPTSEDDDDPDEKEAD